MDNLTHSLIGLATAEAVARFLPTSGSALPAQTRRNLLVTLGVVGGNLPDIDLVISYSGGLHDKLGYMLQHRGYTHTVLGCLLLAILLYASVEAWARWKSLTLRRNDRLAAGGMAVFAILLHLSMDFLNSYGVHPFWPFDNGWRYGDSVFIIEPLYWLAAAPLLFVVRSLVARMIVGIAGLAGLVLCVVTHPGQSAWYGLIALLGAALLAVGARGSARMTAVVSSVVMLTVTAAFLVAHEAAASEVDALRARLFSSESAVDHVLTPIPANPFCFDVVLLTRDRQDNYIARHALLAVMPSLVPVERCPTFLVSRETTASFNPVPVAKSSDISWLGELSIPLSRLASLVSLNCRSRALMQFVRAPYATQLEDHRILGDLRFDREKGLGMSEIDVDAAGHLQCPAAVPWTPPRSDLFHP